MRGLREWLGVALAAAAALYGAVLAQGWQEPVSTPEWNRPYIDLLYLDLFTLLGSWVTVGILALLTVLGVALVLRRRRADVTEAAVPAAKPVAEAPPPAASSPPREQGAAVPVVSPDRIARVIGAPWATPAGLRTAPPADLSPAERMLAEALAKVQRGRGAVADAPARKPPSLRLVPQVPVREAASPAAWLGGGACLPEGFAWPEIDGEALQPLAQVNCAHFPEELWGGVGPREGWLAIFLAPRSLKARVLYFTEAGPFRSAPAVLGDTNMVHPDMWKSESALRPTAVPAIPRWPVDIIVVEEGQEEPRRSGRGRLIGRLDYLDIAEPRFQPFDWPSTQMMMHLAVSGFERFLQSPEAALEPDGPAMLDKLRDLSAAADVMAGTVPFSPDIAAAILAETRLLPPFLPRNPPKLNGRKSATAERTGEGTPGFGRPATPPAQDPTFWQVPYVRYLQDRAKHIHSAQAGPLPAALLSHCEEVWRGWAAHEMAAMGHEPWGKLRNFEENDEVLLLELPSSLLMNWHFGNAANLVLTIRREDLALGDFARVSVQVSS